MREITWPRAAVLALAIGFLGFSLAVFLNRQDEPVSRDSVDAGFYQDMIVHHEQALQMAQAEIARGEDPTVRELAQEILRSQSWEIGLMDRSLEEWDLSSSDRPDTAMEWMGMPLPVDRMPGLMPEARMDELEQADGAQADTLFIEMMAEHHEGGVHMAEYAARTADEDHVRELARQMACTQTKEINEYALAAERLDLPAQIDRVPVSDECE